METPLLQAQTVSYAVGGTTLVDAVSLRLQPGEVLALVGPNGAGKSTLLNLLAGDLAPSAGEVRLGGQRLERLDARRQALHRAVLRQRVGLAFPFSVLDVVLMGRFPHLNGRTESASDLEIARQALEQTEMQAFTQRAFPTLSGGEQTRAALARVLAQAAPILLLDEPTAALDLCHQHATLALAHALAEAGGAVLVVLHDLNLAALYAHRIGLLQQGRLVALGSPDEVLCSDRLSLVYRTPIRVSRHPDCDVPLVLALPRSPISA